MKSKFSTHIFAMTLLGALAIPIGLAAQEDHEAKHERPRYIVKDLGTLGGTFGQATGINNKDRITGFALLPHNTALRAFFLSKGRKTDLGTLGGPNSITFAKPTNRGEVVGAAETSKSDPLGEDFCFFGTHLVCLAFVWQKGTMTALPNLGGNNGTANYINNGGQVAGVAENTTLDSTCPNSEYQAEPVIWDNGVPQQLPTVSGDLDGAVNAINDQSVAVGGTGDCATTVASNPLHAVLWQNNSPTDLGSLGGTLFSAAYSINNQGQVVGSSDLSGDTSFFGGPRINNHAFRWQNGVISDLGTLPGDANSFAFSINKKGQMVGAGSRAIVWDDDGLTDLNTLVPGPPFSPLYLLSALDINDRGEIVGEGLDINGDLHAYLAIPCEESHGDVEACHSDGRLDSTETPTQLAPAPRWENSAGWNDVVRGRRPWGMTMWNRPEALIGRYPSNATAGTARRP